MKKNARLTIAYLATQFERDNINESIWNGIMYSAAENDVNVICLPMNPINIQDAYFWMANALFNLVTEKNFDGLLVWGSGLTNTADSDDVNSFFNSVSTFPLVNIGMGFKGLPGIMVDNYSGVYDICRHLIEVHSCSRIAFLRGPIGHDEAEVRFNAYQDALKMYNINYDPDLVTVAGFAQSGGIKGIKTLLDERKAGFDAVVCSCDRVAFTAMMELENRGIRIPEDVKVTGFDDLEASRYQNPPLTTVLQPFYEMGKYSVELLLARIKGEKSDNLVKVPSRIIIRESCGCNRDISDNYWIIPEFKGRKADAEELAVYLQNRIFFNLKRTDQYRQLIKSFSESVTAFVNSRGRNIDTVKSLIESENIPEQVLNDLLEISDSSRKYLMSCMNENETSVFRIEYLFTRITAFINSKIQRFKNLRKITEQVETQTIQDLNYQVNASFDINDIYNVFSEEFPHVGINQFYIVLYVEPENSLDRAVLKLALTGKGRIDIDEKYAEFQAEEIIPDRYSDTEQRYSYIVEPIYFERENLGYFVIDGEIKYAYLYTTMQRQLSIAIKGTLLIQEKEELLKEIKDHAAEIQDAMEKLKISNSELEQFSFIASHDLKEPLRKIQIFSELINEKYRGNLDEKATELLDKMNKSAERMKLLINNLLEYSRVTTNAKPFVIVDLKEAAESAVNFLEVLIGHSKAEITIDDMPGIEADPSQIHQLFQNLISNAVKFQKPGNRPVIKISCRKKLIKSVLCCEIRIQDNGIGIKKEYQDVIFGVFQRLHTQKDYEGTGIGLAICKRVIERHKGTISVESRHGKGTAFIIILPMKQPKQQ